VHGSSKAYEMLMKDSFELRQEHSFVRLDAERQSPTQCCSFVAPELSAVESRITAGQANVEAEERDKKEEVFVSCSHQAPERFQKGFGENVVPSGKAKAGATSTSAAITESLRSPATSSWHRLPREAGLGTSPAARNNNARQVPAAENTG